MSPSSLSYQCIVELDSSFEVDTLLSITRLHYQIAWDLDWSKFKID